jgi:hypothetical protein
MAADRRARQCVREAARRGQVVADRRGPGGTSVETTAKPHPAVTLGSMLSSLASIVLGFWMLGYFALAWCYFSFLGWTKITGQTWRGFVFEVTRPLPFAILIGVVALAAALGGLGYWPNRRSRAAGLSTSFGAAILRFSLLGLSGAAADAAVLAILLIQRWWI